jgi:hypothetical protein
MRLATPSKYNNLLTSATSRIFLGSLGVKNLENNLFQEKCSNTETLFVRREGMKRGNEEREI